MPSSPRAANKKVAWAKLHSLTATPPQRAAALCAIQRATTISTINVDRQAANIVVRIERAGGEGRQVIESAVRPDGDKVVVQYAFDASGRLVHRDEKQR